MVERLFITVLEISFATGIVILILKLLSAFLNNRYTAKLKYWIWMVLAIRLIIPISFAHPEAPVKVAIPDTQLYGIGRGINEIAASVRMSVAAPFMQSAQSSVTLFDIVMAVWVLGCISFLL